MHTCFWRMNFQVDFTGCFEQGCSSLCIQAAHLPQMARKVALNNEIREHSLFKHRRMSVDEIAYRPERLHQMPGQDQIADSQSGKEHLAECADVNHATVVIQAL